MAERLQKILARAGFGSRREIEKLIAEGLVKVNNRTAVLGDCASPEDKIQVRNQLVKATRLVKQPTQVLLYNKPEGQVTSRKDEKGRDTVFQHLPRIINSRWVAVGRLDINTSGLLIFTNNGELANRMMHPSYEVEREYSVRVFGEVTDEILKQLKKGVKLEDGWAKFDRIVKLPLQEDSAVNQWYQVTLKEGRNREVRRIWEAAGVQVSRLIRTRYGLFQLPRSLRQGKTEALTWRQVNQLLKSVGLPEEPRPDQFFKATEKNTISTAKAAKGLKKKKRNRPSHPRR